MGKSVPGRKEWLGGREGGWKMLGCKEMTFPVSNGGEEIEEGMNWGEFMRCLGSVSEALLEEATWVWFPERKAQAGKTGEILLEKEALGWRKVSGTGKADGILSTTVPQHLWRIGSRTPQQCQCL